MFIIRSVDSVCREIKLAWIKLLLVLVQKKLVTTFQVFVLRLILWVCFFVRLLGETFNEGLLLRTLNHGLLLRMFNKSLVWKAFNECLFFLMR